MIPRTQTGMLETLLEHAQDIERVVRHRLSAPEEPDTQERVIVDQLLRQSVGVQRLLRKWIRVRASHERRKMEQLVRS